MARINIEEEFWQEVIPLVSQLGDQDRAVGNVVRFWRYAQIKHKAEKLITEEEFQAMGFSEALFPMFARRTDGGIMAAGAEKHFSWLIERAKSGSKGGHAKRVPKPVEEESLRENHSEASKPKQIEANRSNPKQTEANRSNPKQPEASYSYSPSYSYSSVEEKKAAPAIKKVTPPERDPVLALVDTIPPAIQVTWETVWGAKLVQTELPKAAAWWITNPEKRQIGDTFPRFANGWFQREKENPKKTPSSPPKNPDKPPPPTLVEKLDPITGELKVAIAGVPNGT